MALKRFIAVNGLDANSKTIINVTDPVGAQDAATKNFATNASNLASGTVPVAQMPAFTGGDATSSAGSVNLTLSTVNSNVGSFGSTSAIPVITVDGKGRITAVTTAAVASSSVTLTGDISATGNTGSSITTTLATVNSNVGAFGSATAVPTITVNAKGLVTAVSTNTITPAGIGAVATSALGANSGVATLDGSGKLTSSQIPSSLTGALVYQSTWNAATNTPTIPAAATGNKGYYYKVSTGGSTTIDGFSNWTAGDLLISNGTSWDAVQGGSSDVISVAGKVGAVTLVAADVGGLAASATTDTTNAANISTGTLGAARLPQFTGGDVTTAAAGSVSLSLATQGSVVTGTYNSATQVMPITINSKGVITATGTATTITPAWSSISSKPTTLSGFGITDALSNVAGTAQTIPLAQGSIGSATLVTAATTANQIVDTNSTTTYRSVKYQVQLTSSTSYHMTTIDVIHDGTNAYVDQYGDVYTGVSLATFDADVSGGNLRLLTTPTNAATTYKVIKTLVNA